MSMEIDSTHVPAQSLYPSLLCSARHLALSTFRLVPDIQEERKEGLPDDPVADRSWLSSVSTWTLAPTPNEIFPLVSWQPLFQKDTQNWRVFRDEMSEKRVDRGWNNYSG